MRSDGAHAARRAAALAALAAARAALAALAARAALALSGPEQLGLRGPPPRRQLQRTWGDPGEI